MTSKLKKSDIRRVARRTVKALALMGYKSCLFGSAACFLWGNDRVPNDVDVVVLTDDSTEHIKERLLETDNHFYVVNGRNGPYKVLWYYLSWQPKKRCKVDILIPGRRPPLLDIPKIVLPSITHFTDFHIPVMPFLPLLILKVQGWSDHRRSSKYWFQAKAPQDEEDIANLLSILPDGNHLKRFGWFPRWFVQNANNLVEEYVESFPQTRSEWRSIGFEV